MTSQQLPERPNLEQLKKQAKSLLRAAQEKDPTALERFQTVLNRPLTSDAVALHNAQFVVAREYGYKSWNDLREEVETRSLSLTTSKR